MSLDQNILLPTRPTQLISEIQWLSSSLATRTLCTEQNTKIQIVLDRGRFQIDQTVIRGSVQQLEFPAPRHSPHYDDTTRQRVAA